MAWWEQRRKNYEELFGDNWIADFRSVRDINQSLTGLPVPLAAACAKAQTACKEALTREIAFAHFKRLLPMVQDQYPALSTAPSQSVETRTAKARRGAAESPPMLAYKTLQLLTGERSMTEGGHKPYPAAYHDTELREAFFAALEDPARRDELSECIRGLSKISALRL